jgi:hypothetical protein
VLIYVAAYTVLGKENIARTTVLAGVLVLVAVAIWSGAKWYDRSQAAGVAVGSEQK